MDNARNNQSVGGSLAGLAATVGLGQWALVKRCSDSSETVNPSSALNRVRTNSYRLVNPVTYWINFSVLYCNLCRMHAQLHSKVLYD